MSTVRSAGHCPRTLRRFLRHGTMIQLAAFEAVVRLGSATRAAESLCMAQPTLSGHLRKLSEALGVRLFELNGKRLVPTDAAIVLLHAAGEVFAAFERCETAIAGLRSADARAQLPIRPPSSLVITTTDDRGRPAGNAVTPSASTAH